LVPEGKIFKVSADVFEVEEDTAAILQKMFRFCESESELFLFWSCVFVDFCKNQSNKYTKMQINANKRK
jgi:hypothetical protein